MEPAIIAEPQGKKPDPGDDGGAHRPPSRKIRLALLLLLAAGICLTEAGLIYYLCIFNPADPRVSASWKNGALVVTKDLKGLPPSGGLHVKDQIVAAWYTGTKKIFFHGPFDNGRAARALQPGKPLHITVLRRNAEGREHEVVVTLPPVQPGPAHVLSRLANMAPNLLILLACILASLLIGLSRPEDEGAYAASLLFLCFTSLHWGGSQYLFPPPFRDLSLWLWFILEASLTPALLWFCLRFPSPSPLDERLPWLKRVGVAFGFVFAVWNGILWYIQETDEGIYIQYVDSVRAADWGLDLIFCLLAVVGLAALVRKTATSRSPDERRRLVILLFGILGLFPWLLTFLHTVTVGGSTPLAWNIFVVLAEVLFPVCFIYAVLKHRVFGIRVFLRRGLKFALLSKGFLTLEGAAIFMGLYYAAGPSVGRIAGEDGGGVMAVAIAGITVASVLGIRKVNGRVLHPIERRFFREAYDARQVLTSLTVNLRRLVGDPDALAAAVVDSVSGTLHPATTAVFLRAGVAANLPFSRERSRTVRRATSEAGASTFVSFWRRRLTAKDSGAEADPKSLPLLLSGSSSVLAMFAREDSAPGLVNLDPKDPQSRAELLDETGSAEEKALLQDGLRARLLIPLSAGREVVGFLALGEKLSEEPYSREDEELLLALTQQMADTLDHARLLHQSEEQAQLRREVEIAQQVQQNLLPRRPIPVPGLEYDAACKPARYVGGDYYDFIRRGDARVGLALGDISGKGVSAALLMASLQATLREQADVHGEDLKAFMAGVNRRLCESASEGRFSTLFYGVIDAQAKTLTYVNAGHNPPMLFRPAGNGAEVLRLDPTGAIIGFFPEQTFGQRQVALQPRDVLVIFSDGVTEAMNEGGEFFEEERLQALVPSLLGLPAAAIRDRILEEVGRFAGTAPQADDITLLVARVL